MKHDTKDGTKGFSPQLSGNAKAGKTHTSSFDVSSPDNTLADYSTDNESISGQEEGGRMRYQSTSAAGRVYEQDKKNS